ncbi:LOW QUALITY PROTEIN: hypothetical protein CFOL_v3_13792, partial [Cephalotus follicularis]
SAVPMPPAGWPVPPRPQPWYPQPPAVSIPPAAPMGYVHQPLFPVQNVRPPMPTTTSATIQPPLVAPPGLPSSTPPVLVSQPLFPVVNNNLPNHSSPFSAPLPSTSIPSISSVELKGSIDRHLGANTSMTNSYHTPSIPGGALVNSQSYASGPNTSGPSIGPPPVIANKAPATQPAVNEVYLVGDDEAMSMEERRMSLSKYQVHDETSQVSHNYLLNICNWFAHLTRWVGFMFRYGCLRILSYIERYFLCEFQFMCTLENPINEEFMGPLIDYLFTANHWLMDMLFIIKLS